MPTATCPACHRIMEGASCTQPGAWPWGDEPHHGDPPAWDCRDCGVHPGGLHHDGCTVATCPRCLDQRLACQCGGPLVN